MCSASVWPSSISCRYRCSYFALWKNRSITPLVSGALWRVRTCANSGRANPELAAGREQHDGDGDQCPQAKLVVQPEKKCDANQSARDDERTLNQPPCAPKHGPYSRWLRSIPCNEPHAQRGGGALRRDGPCCPDRSPGEPADDRAASSRAHRAQIVGDARRTVAAPMPAKQRHHQGGQPLPAGPPHRGIPVAPLVEPGLRHPQRPARDRVRNAMLGPLSGDERGHGYRPIAS